MEFVLENVVIFAGKNELKSFFCAVLSHCFSIYVVGQIRSQVESVLRRLNWCSSFD